MAFLLIVDDDPDFAESIAMALQRDGHETLVESESDRVLPLLERRTPDAVILDVMFPENPCAGFELAREIGRTYRQVPILMLTAVNDQYPLGFSEKDVDPTWLPIWGFLEKPVDFEVLRDKVRQLLTGGK